VSDGGHETIAGVVAGVIIGGVIEVEAKTAHIVQHYRVCHGPGAAGDGIGRALPVMEGHFQIGKGHIMGTDAGTKPVKALVAILRDPAGDENVTGGKKGRFGHGKPPKKEMKLQITKGAIIRHLYQLG
jgi:hypothetical protein